MGFGDELLAFLADETGLPETEFNGDKEIFSSGLLDSFALIRLVQFIEKKNGIRVKPGELAMENLDTPARIVAFVDGKKE